MDDARVIEAPSGTKFAPGPTPERNDLVPDSANAPSVALFHDYRESVSMRLYAEQLGAALERLGVVISRVRPRDVIPPGHRRGPLDKVDSYLGRFFVYPRLARRAVADVFHIVDHGQGHLVSSLDPARTVVTCHDVILLVAAARRIRADVTPVIATRILRRSVEIMKRARRIIAVSEHTRTDLANLAGIAPEKVDVIYPGLNHPFSPAPERRAEIRRRLGLPSKSLLLHVGYTGFYKNIPGCLRVIARVRAAGVDATLVRVGSAMTPKQRAIAERLGLAEHVIELGSLAPEVLADIYRAADVLLFPSLYEGFGWPPLEAMASGLPVVSTRAGALGEAVGDAALTFEPEDVRGLAEAVARVLTCDHVRESLVRRGIERARGFDWNKTAARLLEVYRKVAEG